MTRQCAWVFLVLLASAGGASASPLCERQQRGADQKPQDSRPNDPPRWKWWVHPESRKELRLTDQQVKDIDQIFESTMPQQRDRMHEIERLDEALSRAIKEATADVATVSKQVEKIEKLRAEERATRTVMLYRVYLVLTPEQRVKVDAIRARLDEERRKRQEEERKKDGKGERR